MRKNGHKGARHPIGQRHRIGRNSRTVNAMLRKQVLLAFGGFVLLLFVVGVFQLQRAAASGSNQSPLPPAKAAILAHQSQAIATARAGHPAKPSHYTPPAPVPTETFAPGIIQTHQGPFPNSTFSVADMYRGPIGGQWEIVFAGTAWHTYPTDGLGALRVYSINGALIGTFYAPDHSSYLQITGIHGTVLDLQSDRSTSLTFNLATNTFGG